MNKYLGQPNIIQSRSGTIGTVPFYEKITFMFDGHIDAYI